MVSSDELVRLNHIEKIYQVGSQDFLALHQVNLKIEPSAFMAFVGPSGSGKTTLLNLIGGLDRPTKGEIVLNGNRLSKLSRDELAAMRRTDIGFIFQSHNLLPVYSVYENVLFPLILNGEKEGRVRGRVMEMICLVDLEPFSGKRPTELSGGQCQRVAIARALVKQPVLVLADEPTANLDSENSYHVLDLMKELNKKYQVAFVFSTHDQKVTEYIKREVGLCDGTVVSDKQRNEQGLLE